MNFLKKLKQFNVRREHYTSASKKSLLKVLANMMLTPVVTSVCISNPVNINHPGVLIPTIGVLCTLHPVELNKELNNNEDLFGLTIEQENELTRGQHLSSVINRVEILCINNNTNTYLLEKVKSYATQLHHELMNGEQKLIQHNLSFNYILLLYKFCLLEKFAKGILYPPTVEHPYETKL